MRECPLVLCLTNTVAANFTANCLLAIGAKPAMIDEPCEAGLGDLIKWLESVPSAKTR